jgi:nicotinamide riboside transporter PnuC
MYLLDIIQILSVLFGLVGNYLVNRRNASGFKFWIVSNCLAITVMAAAQLWWMMVMFIAYLILAIDGLRKWRSSSEM